MGALRRSGGCAPEVPAEVPFEIPIRSIGNLEALAKPK
jgi:hypothetical protein